MKQKGYYFTLSLILSLLFSLLSLQKIQAQQEIDTSAFQTLEYRIAGPYRGGRSTAIAGHANRPHEYYFGATGGGLWKTTDGGLTWNPVTDGQINASSVGAVDVADSDPDVVYIGLGESQFRGNIMQGDGIYKSVDAGKTWEHVGLKDSQTVSRVRIHPTNPDIVYAAVLGHPFGPNEERGVFKTTNGGKTWDKVLYKGPKAGAADIILDPNDPETIYASIWEVYRTPWKMWGGGGASGLFKSTNGGKTWEELTNKPGMPQLPIGKIGITVSPVDPNRVWAIIEANEGGVFQSNDAGMTWERTNEDRKLRQRAFYYTRIYADPKDRETVYVLNVDFWKSTDGGVTFDEKIRVPHGDNHDLWIDPNDPNRMAEANDGGGTISVNGGKTWTDEDFPTAQLYHITATNDFPYFIAGAQQDNSTVAIPSEGWDFLSAGNNTLKPRVHSYAVGGGESGCIAQDPNNLDIFYAGSYSAVLTRINRRTGERRRIEPYPRYFMGNAAETLPERVHWTYPIVFSTLEDRLYVTSQHVWTTTSEGQSWEKISPDLTYADPETMGVSGGEITLDMSGPELYATIYALAPSFHEVNTLWAGSDDGLIHITRNHGKSWENITPSGLQKHSRVSIIDASRHKAGAAYVAVKRYQMNDRSPYIFKTNDYGKTWKKIINGIPEGHYVHAVREDITTPGVLYAGTEHGMYVSFDDGEQWNSLQLNLPDVAIRDLAVTEKDLAIATHGRSMWILDDIAPIREYNKENLAKELHLYTPYYAVRRVQDAVFNYNLAREAGEVKIEILDASGEVIQSFVTEEVEEKEEDGIKAAKGEKETSEATAAQEGGKEEKPSEEKKTTGPTTNRGLNTYTWDLRLPGSTVFDGMILWSARPERGPMVVPGWYTVRVTANGKTESERFEVKMDPRIEDVTREDLEEQFDLLVKIREKVSEANEAVIKIREYKESQGEDIDPAVLESLNAVEEAIYQVKNQSNQDPLNYPIRLNNKIATLGLIVDSGEARPTDGAYVVFKELSEELAVLINEMETILLNAQRETPVRN
ncbi:glycosyl hydrolase [Antarcticibacterium flavum]|uniref:Glycosyl hydrolase n=1 Tax=Antarcticibacterium flavum TaxID=2058175 RepID=A0A5B7X373_9FLAO|nr:MULTISPECIES: glycosyl hydrolase [Antarcticibacterium]MCM4159103.1 glycosyl hydrolase [Antarcticibacterium sp. W02-3]QCY69505.1 glycosyl hydrolase [Antarcticibacterium flavum]